MAPGGCAVSRRRPVLVRDLLLMLALFAVVSVAGLAASLIRSPAVILAGVVVGAGAFWGGRRYERRRRVPSQVAPVKRDEPSTRPLPRIPDPADQMAKLGAASWHGRVEAIIASYERVARYHHGGQP